MSRRSGAGARCDLGTVAWVIVGCAPCTGMQDAACMLGRTYSHRRQSRRRATGGRRLRQQGRRAVPVAAVRADQCAQAWSQPAACAAGPRGRAHWQLLHGHQQRGVQPLAHAAHARAWRRDLMMCTSAQTSSLRAWIHAKSVGRFSWPCLFPITLHCQCAAAHAAPRAPKCGRSRDFEPRMNGCDANANKAGC